MCGIVGFAGKEGSREILEKMVAQVIHRGPDEQGIFYQPPIGLGHARLSIIDLAGGHQPMIDEKEKLAVVFNGEIYNFLELRQELEKSDYVFTTNSDTEVILKSYRQWGEECLRRFNGMFALALWDGHRRRLVLARDRLGKKPLYWTYQKGNLVFASEPKALRSYPGMEFSADSQMLAKYFFYDYIPCPHTPWKNIFKLEPAEYLIFEDGKINRSHFWSLADKLPVQAENFSEAKARLDKLLAQAVKYRLIADVPLGVFLSGGIDSSTVAWYAAQAAGQRLKTFSIDFQEKTFGEGQYARQVAKHLGTDHQESVLSIDDALEIVPEIGRHLDEPLADASIVPTYLLSKFTKQSVTTALGGDGADELFCGYQTFLAEKYYQIYRHFPFGARKILEKAVNLLPVSHSYFSLDFKLKKFVQARQNPLVRHQNWLSTFSLDDLPWLLNQEVDENEILAEVNSFGQELRGDDWDKIIASYQRFYMQERVLVKVDRASMKTALEVRAPFLDWRVVEFVNSLPLEYKFSGGRTKRLLKKLMVGRLPDNIINRPKKGFALPLAVWFCGPLKELFGDLATRENIEKSGILRYDYVNSLFQQHLAKKANHGQKLWSILMFLFWQQHYF